jgi:hypothetical protein
MLLLGYQNCGRDKASQTQTPSSAPNTTYTATVVKPANLDGCRWLLCMQDNVLNQQKCIIPVKLDSRYIVEGNVIKVEGHENPDVVTTCMAGNTFEVSKVELVSGSMNNNIPSVSPTATPTPTPTATP